MKFNHHNFVLITIMSLGIAILLPGCSGLGSRESIQTPRGVTQSFVFYPVEKPVANVILFPGGNGVLSQLSKNFLVRSKHLFGEQGFTVAILDTPSDYREGMDSGFRLSDQHAEDLQKVITDLRSRNGVPVWLIGTSAGSWSAASVASLLRAGIKSGPGKPDGVVLTSSAYGVAYGVDLTLIQVPTLVVHHLKDQCKKTPYSGALEIKKGLKHLRASALITMEGGFTTGNPCNAQSFHGYQGIEGETVEQISAWIKAHNS